MITKTGNNIAIYTPHTGGGGGGYSEPLNRSFFRRSKYLLPLALGVSLPTIISAIKAKDLSNKEKEELDKYYNFDSNKKDSNAVIRSTGDTVKQSLRGGLKGGITGAALLPYAVAGKMNKVYGKRFIHHPRLNKILIGAGIAGASLGSGIGAMAGGLVNGIKYNKKDAKAAAKINKIIEEKLPYIDKKASASLVGDLIIPAYSMGVGANKAGKLNEEEEAILKKYYELSPTANLKLRNAGRGVSGYYSGASTGAGLGSLAGLGLAILSKGAKHPRNFLPIVAAGGATGSIIGSVLGIRKMTDRYSKNNAKEVRNKLIEKLQKNSNNNKLHRGV